MSTKIVLTVRNVKLDDSETLATLAEHLSDLGWESFDGQVTAILYTNSPDTVNAALDAARAIRRHLPSASVTRIDEQIVAVGDIADRLGVSHEAVRLWVTGQRRNTNSPFPAPRGTVSRDRTPVKVWAWADVLAWLRIGYRLDPEPDVQYPSGRDTSLINAALCYLSTG